MYALGMDGMEFLRTSDPFKRTLMLAVLEELIDRTRELHKSLANDIASAVWKAVK